MMRFGEDAAVMATIKSMANKCGVTFVLIGSFDLLEFIENSGQIARRSDLLNFERYNKALKADCEEFQRIVEDIVAKWPCDEVPNFAAISNDLLDISLGCIGLLTAIFIKAAVMQMRAKGKWNPTFLLKAVKAVKLRSVIEAEIVLGEARIKDALMGQGAWDANFVESLASRMEQKHAH